MGFFKLKYIEKSTMQLEPRKCNKNMGRYHKKLFKVKPLYTVHKRYLDLKRDENAVNQYNRMERKCLRGCYY